MYADLGPGLEADIGLPSADGASIFYSHRYVAERIRRRQPTSARSRAGDANLYGYAGNSPTSRTDPSGLDWNGWSNAGKAIWGALGYTVTGSEFPSALEAAPDAAKIAIINVFREKAYKALSNGDRDAAAIQADYEAVKKHFQTPPSKRCEP